MSAEKRDIIPFFVTNTKKGLRRDGYGGSMYVDHTQNGAQYVTEDEPAAQTAAKN